jgi:hypothetical protein
MKQNVILDSCQVNDSALMRWFVMLGSRRTKLAKSDVKLVVDDARERQNQSGTAGC